MRYLHVKFNLMSMISHCCHSPMKSQSISLKHLVFDLALGQCHPRIQIDYDLVFDLSLGEIYSIELAICSLGYFSKKS